MFTAERPHSEIIWNRLQEPIRTASLSQDYLLLLAAIDTGWRINGPAQLIHIGERFVECAYVFDLHHDRLSQQIQLAVQATPAVETFLCEEGVAVTLHENTHSPHPAGLVC